VCVREVITDRDISANQFVGEFDMSELARLTLLEIVFVA
jgi:hypothetical protein